MSDMVEAVARAVSAAMGEDWREPPYNRLHTDALNNRARFIARAAIEAMREPDQSVLSAGEDAWCRHNHGDPYSNEIADIWSTMIDAALTNGEEL